MMLPVQQVPMGAVICGLGCGMVSLPRPVGIVKRSETDAKPPAVAMATAMDTPAALLLMAVKCR